MHLLIYNLFLIILQPNDLANLIPKCPHLHTVVKMPSDINTDKPCQKCNIAENNCICLQCFAINCGRKANMHALDHGENAKHPLSLRLEDSTIWCYECESYIDNPGLNVIKQYFATKKLSIDL